MLPKLYFLEHLRREKLRANRIHSPLSMVLFCIESEEGNHSNGSTAFLASLQSMIRETDILGYAGKNVIALLLADTNKQGAEELIKKIVNSHHRFSYSLDVATYPDRLFETLQSEGGLRPDRIPFFFDEMPRIKKSSQLLKRSIDIIGSLVGIVVFSPLMLMVAIMVKLTSPGPVIFKQVRMGMGGVPFVFYKFRSMYSDTDDQSHRKYVEKFISGNHEEVNQGTTEKPLYKMSGDPRITRVGGVLRMTSVDELPQLYNVLKGEMSLVGPRPPLPYEVKNAVPGISGAYWK